MADEGLADSKSTRELQGSAKWFVYALALSMGLFHLYTAAFGIFDTLLHRSLHLGLALVLIFFLYPTSKKKPEKYLAIDLILVGLSLAVTIYIWLFYDYISNRLYYVTPLTLWDKVFGSIIIILVLESTRRTVGMPMVIIALLCLFYGVFGHHVPGTFETSNIPFRNLIDALYLSTTGIYGTPIGVSSTYVILFILFGAFLQVSGIGNFFYDLALALTGKTKGGSAKVSVVSSALFGTISGSAGANVVVDGWLTIPFMKKSGFRSDFAAAVEAAASTGGQFTPPVMGAAAFLIVEMTGIPYGRLCLAAALPAFLYYWTLYWTIHFEAGKLGLGGVDMIGMPTFIQSLRRQGHLFIPIVGLLILLVMGYTPFLAVFYAIICVPILSLLKRETRMGPRLLGEAIQIGVKNALPIASACATAGIIMGIILITGSGFKFVDLILSVSKNILFYGILLTAIASIMLGMGLPTTGAYIIAAAVAAPALVKMGLSLLSSHMFILYYACISAITPPVALAAYTAAGIAGSKMMQTGITATRLGLAGLIVPFYFIYRPSLLLEGSFGVVILDTLIVSFGLYFLAASLEGWTWRRLSPIMRGLYLLVGLLLIYPNRLTDIAGIILGIAFLIYPWLQKRRHRKSPTIHSGECGLSSR